MVVIRITQGLLLAFYLLHFCAVGIGSWDNSSWEGPQEVSSLTSGSEQSAVGFDLVPQRSVWLGPDNPQGQRAHSPSVQPVPLLGCAQLPQPPRWAPGHCSHPHGRRSGWRGLWLLSCGTPALLRQSCSQLVSPQPKLPFNIFLEFRMSKLFKC